MSLRSAATIDTHCRSGGEERRDKEHHCIRDILRLADPARLRAGLGSGCCSRETDSEATADHQDARVIQFG